MRGAGRGIAGVLLLALLAPGAWSAEARQAHAHEPPQVLAPGYARLEFEAPVPGTYRLPPLGTAADAVLLDRDGKAVRLHELFDERLVILSFIYTRCSDVNGCPLATHVLGRVHGEIARHADLQGRVRLVSVSFDPGHDTPAVMDRYAAAFSPPGADWHFLTAASDAAVAPVLRDYDQWVVRDRDADGNDLGTMSHLLRVYLIDAQQRIRNVYSVSFLHADTLAADLRTLLLEND
ncbi:MAG TPA: SCO family protein [Pseudomonadales bacterium]|nr:SCO family protein [Pseudomonadales bacterium]